MKTSEEVAWSAGLLDGEGCIGVYNGAADHGLYLSVSLSMCHKTAVTRLKEIHGGCTYKERNRSSGGREIWSWRAQSATAAKILSVMFPYLVVKKDQARAALQFQDTMTTSGNRGAGGKDPRFVPDSVKAERIRLAKLIKDMKKPPIVEEVCIG